MLWSGSSKAAVQDDYYITFRQSDCWVSPRRRHVAVPSCFCETPSTPVHDLLSRHDSSGHSTQTLKQDLDSSFRILKTLCRKLKLPEDLDYQQLARLTPGYVGADLMALCREAAMNAVNRVLIHLGGCPGSSSQHPSTAGSQTHNNGAEGQTTDSDPGPGVQPGQDPPQVCISDGSIVLELHTTEA